jgi:hypothetical protein
MDIEAWKRKLDGAERDGLCGPSVHCEVCGEAFQVRVVEILKVRRASETWFYYVCLVCQWDLGIRW